MQFHIPFLHFVLKYALHVAAVLPAQTRNENNKIKMFLVLRQRIRNRGILTSKTLRAPAFLISTQATPQGPGTFTRDQSKPDGDVCPASHILLFLFSIPLCHESEYFTKDVSCHRSPVTGFQPSAPDVKIAWCNLAIGSVIKNDLLACLSL